MSVSTTLDSSAVCIECHQHCESMDTRRLCCICRDSELCYVCEERAEDQRVFC